MVNNTVKMTVAALLVLFVSAGTALAADEVLARIGKEWSPRKTSNISSRCTLKTSRPYSREARSTVKCF